MIYFTHSVDRLNAGRTARPLRFIGFGIRHPRSNTEQIIPNRYNAEEHISLVFNHEPLQVRINGSAMNLPADTLVVWNTKVRAIYGEAGKQWRISWLQIAGPEVDALLEKNAIPFNTPISFGSERVINLCWMPLLEEFCGTIPLDMPLVLHHIEGIFLEARRILAHPGADSEQGRIPEPFLRIRNKMDRICPAECDLRKLAAEIHLAPVYFCRKFKEYFGLPPVNYMILRRLHNAALLLRSSGLSIQEIAEQTGYHNAFHFSRQFKRHFGISPSLFREDGFTEKSAVISSRRNQICGIPPESSP